MKRHIQCAVVMAIMLLAGCKQGRVLAPVTEGWRQTAVHDSLYKVQENDTLYSVAWAYDVDYRHLAKINHIKPPYDLQPGRKLKIYHRDEVHTRAPKPSSVRTAPVNLSAGAVSNASEAIISSPESTMPAQPSIAKPLAQSLQASDTPPWVWPAKGEVVGKFNAEASGPKGIEIAAKEGSPVFATQAGRVVYSGNGLRGYGNLLIVKHNDEYLSAYAHNSELLVQEGESVSQGQQIAAMGKTGAGSVKLHFEIRRAGLPVDPIPYLTMTA